MINTPSVGLDANEYWLYPGDLVKIATDRDGYVWTITGNSQNGNVILTRGGGKYVDYRHSHELFWLVTPTQKEN